MEAGQLPPVEERLPKNPYVVPHAWLQSGKYGGRMRMACSDAWGTAHFMQESMYGNSPLRWLNDGLDIGPGLIESWASNDDASEWTFNFREGLRWSDGQPWTTADVMYWWEDMVLNEEHPSSPPDETRSGKGTLMTMQTPDEVTLVLRFDAPAPLTAHHLARWVNMGIGPAWMWPKHYLQQFHPKYNPELKGKEDWVEQHDQKMDFATNPECPTMTGWRLESYSEERQSVWVRNPYYWCVDKEGNQLPYIDGVTYSYVQNPEVLKLRFTEGRADYVHGPHSGLTLADISQLRRSEGRSGLETILWDGGSGTGSIFFFNYDYREPKMRALIREPKFRQALSLAFNREEVRRSVYFNQGEPTTGTYSPKALDFLVNDEAKDVYRRWRDSYIGHDLERAQRLLDEIDVVDRDGDGMREMPGGGKLEVLLEYPAPGASEHVRKNEFLARDWKAIGVSARLNPVAGESYGTRWQAGQIMSNTAWENSGGTHEIMAEPQVLVPLGGFPEWWAPLESNWHQIRNTPAAQQVGEDPYKRTPPSMEPEEGGPIERMWELYDRAKSETDSLARKRLVWQTIAIHIEEGPFFMGAVANTPIIVLVRKGLMNVPRREQLRLNGFSNPWTHPTPAVYDPEAYYWDDPQAHS